MFTLFYSPHTCSLASRIALEDAGAHYPLERIDFAKREQQSAEYLTINPKGRVPALVTPRGILTETPAILVFIAQRFPLAALAPLDDPSAFAELQSFNSYICSTLHVAHAHRMRGHRWAYEASSFADIQRKVPESVGACYDLIEKRATKRNCRKISEPLAGR
jgi:glutathione S-transferase